MGSSSGISEIVESGEEINLSAYFNHPKPIRVKPREGEVKSPNHFSRDDLSRLIEATDLRTFPRMLTASHQSPNEIIRKTASKNPIKISALQASGGSCISESLTLKQALRRLCVSQASEHAAMKRSSKPTSFSVVSEAGTIKRLFTSVIVEGTKSSLSAGQVKKFLEVSPLPRTTVPNLCLKTSQVYNVSNTNSSCKRKEAKITIQDVIASPSKVSEVGIKRRLNPKSTSKTGHKAESGPNKIPVKANLFFTKKGGQEPTLKVIKAPNSREKGDCSQSSISSLGDYSSSTTTSLSGESSQSGSSGNAIRPHMSKDVKWVAIRHALTHHGSLGLMNFKLVKKLGCGDIGTVYLAELTGSGCLFALKVMDVEFLLSRKKILRAQSERDILQILDHPFLPTLFAHFTTDNLSCLVMEYCPGGDLHVLRQRQPGRRFSEPAARFYVAEVLLALEYLHMLGVIYRDLKPENILVREDGHIMLSDFDLSLRCTVNPTLLKSSSLDREEDAGKMAGPCAESSCIGPNCLHPSLPQVSCFTPRLLSRNRKTGPDSATQVSPLPQLVVEPTGARSNSFVGTHEYLAPEIIKGDGHGSAVDWWTYGIFLYELLYGRTPFKGPGNEETLSNVVCQSLRFPETPSVSIWAMDLVKGLLAKDPESRLGSVMGAAEIKRHPFFEGLNWALIRCAAPPEVPGGFDRGTPTSIKTEGMEIDLF